MITDVHKHSIVDVTFPNTFFMFIFPFLDVASCLTKVNSRAVVAIDSIDPWRFINGGGLRTGVRQLSSQ